MNIQLKKIFKDIIPDIDVAKIDIKKNSNSKLGDFQTSFAMKFFKQGRTMYNVKNFEEFAIIIIEKVPKIIAERFSFTKPGFINFFLKDQFLSEQINRKWPTAVSNKRKYLIDYSSPNIAKEMHVGHLRSTIIGDVLGNLFEDSGNNVVRINHVGDWGTQFGMLIAYLETMTSDLEEDGFTLSDLHHCYKKSKKLFDTDVEFNNLAHRRVVDLQNSEPKCINTWKKICKISEMSYKSIYKRLFISEKLLTMGESSYNDSLNKIVDELEEKGLLTTEDNGAKLMFLHKKVPLIIRKSDGGYGYDTTDLAALKHRIFVEKVDEIIYVTDMGQKLHFELIFEAAKRAGWIDNQRFHHVSFGIVVGDDGKRIKSRSGDSIKLSELLDTGKSMYIEKNRERLDNNLGQIDIESLEQTSELIANSAVKYADLKQNRNNNYQFSFEKMLDFRGDTIIYQLYAWIRLVNILNKSDKCLENCKFVITNDIERRIVKHICELDDNLTRARDKLLPNIVCEYLNTLSQLINEFWTNCKIIGDSNELNRLILCKKAKCVMARCFKILGIPCDEIKNL